MRASSTAEVVVKKFHSALWLVLLPGLGAQAIQASDVPATPEHSASGRTASGRSAPFHAVSNHGLPPQTAPKAPAKPLDLSAPNFFSSRWQDRLQGPTLEPQEVLQEAVVVRPSSDTPRTRIGPVGIGSLWWAALHPDQAWRVLLPVQAGDEFDMDTNLKLAYSDTLSECPGFVGTPNVRPICP